MELQRQIDLHAKVRSWLMTDWDPIGVANFPEAFSEYHGYERAIADLLITGATPERLAEHLLTQETMNMGLTGDPAKALLAARRLCQRFTEFGSDQNEPYV
jgi:hypothetical protein